MEKQYLVEWKIDMWAESPIEAAQKAYNLMQEPGNEANFFTVSEASEDGPVNPVDIDLLYEEEEEEEGI